MEIKSPYTPPEDRTIFNDPDKMREYINQWRIKNNWKSVPTFCREWQKPEPECALAGYCRKEYSCNH